MKDYFSAIINQGVAGVPRCAPFTELNKTEAFSLQTSIQPYSSLRCDRCTNFIYLAHAYTPTDVEGGTVETKETAVSPLSHAVTLKKNGDIFYSYHERAAIMEFEAGLDRQEAESLAYQDTLRTYLIIEHPEILGQFESIIHQPFLI